MAEKQTAVVSTEQSEFPKKGQSARGTDSAYTVEARCTMPHPQIVCGEVWGERWRTVNFAIAKGHGVPGCGLWEGGLQFGFLPYASAQALRWWFIANAGHDDYKIETRLIKHEITYSRSEEPVAAVDFIDHMGARGMVVSA